MPATEKQTVINAPAAKVFAYVADFSKHPEWGKHIVELTPTSQGPTALGSTFRSSAKQLGNHEATIRVSAFEPDRLLAYDVTDNTGDWHHEMRLTESGGQTTLVKTIQMVRPANVMSRVFAALFFPFLGSKGIQGDVDKIKERVEAGG